ncbi:MAG TPA: ATP-binding cassette domain-containing protein, partial [Chitinispirillaceae bacterium]|nr:ATP-binding cassette domain-containing protein [Chitinispirillaceae bacterium]
KIILGIYKADSFSMKLCGKSYNEKTHQSAWTKHVWGKQAGMVFQHADESLNLQATVKETFDGLRGRMQGDLDTLLGQLFTPRTIEAIKHKKTAFLSGGQKQRLNLLRTLALNTDLVIFDEPLNGLDFVNVKKVLELLNQLRMNGTAILMISHNEEIFEALIDEENILYLAEV